MGNVDVLKFLSRFEDDMVFHFQLIAVVENCSWSPSLSVFRTESVPVGDMELPQLDPFGELVRKVVQCPQLGVLTPASSARWIRSMERVPVFWTGVSCLVDWFFASLLLHLFDASTDTSVRVSDTAVLL